MYIFIALVLTSLALLAWAIVEFVNSAAIEVGRFAVEFVTHAPLRRKCLSFVERLTAVPELILARIVLVSAVVAIWTYVP